ncbi:TPMT family class I SAM-dependent methyltransferase [Gillisia sp. M10.2A]|uniref:TPMT family class I SAM-dependent methyltransferase n=1 Tax=Gillisia lutea TaxID=2909668 RepID=A0ABS9EI22_9FLAO|nr:methyltransferase [Gillisia lutea]MCF4102497.1 TPMT family class I SAM-dependent methyltransferase [Gillisia lutea]
MELNSEYWSNRYQENNTGWDVGAISTPLKEYIDQIEDKSIKILIPGAGNSHEAEYLVENGFTNVYVLDFAKEPLLNLKQRIPEFPDEHLLNADFFTLNDKFDIILEQTFFCALPVNKRKSYAQKMHSLLKDEGKFAGLLFNFELTENGPPFGGSKEEYLNYFSPYFETLVFEPCYNSIAPRSGNELFFIFKKK